MRCYAPIIRRILPRSFYARDTVTVAKDLLGCRLQTADCTARIVEVEAYLGEGDLAAHSARGITPRTRVIFGPPGHAYVYFIYGMYECLNLVAEPEHQAGCVLIRAVEPQAGLEHMERRRGKAAGLTNGPGKLTLAMGITRSLHNGVDVTAKGSPLVVLEPDCPVHETIHTTTRIGIRHSAELPLRFYLRGNAYVSRT
ncbi:putative 3-methyladenine DNA glycosylase [Bryobacterales bacterium F-183]|nr:putative 3-methyladenine DNA glycosylase [Bryobacterales bacterium F-183]